MPERAFAAVLGKPIAHSLSPVLHRAAYEVLGLSIEYRAYELETAQLADFLAGEGAAAIGFSLTMPLKQQAFKLARVSDPAALATSACNTLVRQQGGWAGYNTDVPGFANALTAAAIAPTAAVVLGAGATARSAVVALQQLGVTEIQVAARRVAAAAELAADCGLSRQAALDLSLPLPSADLLVSTLPAGAADGIAIPAECSAVFDVVYAPWPTQLAAIAATAGLTVLGGLELLVEQAVLAVQLQTGCGAADLERVRHAMFHAGRIEQAARSR